MVGAKVDVFQVVMNHTHIDRVLGAMIAPRRRRVDLGTLAAMKLVLVSH